MTLGDRGFVSDRSPLAGWPNFVMVVVDDLILTTKKKKMSWVWVWAFC